MAQFDVHRIKGHGLVVDCQHGFLSDLRSRVVAPLRTPDEPTVSHSRLNPEVEVDGARYRVAVQFMRAVDRQQLGAPLASLTGKGSEIRSAVDLLISGF